jgi:AraC-like DNA-binding protein
MMIFVKQRSIANASQWLSLDVIRWSLAANRKRPEPVDEKEGRMDHSKRLMLCLLAYAAQRDLSPVDILARAEVRWKDLYDWTARISPEQIGYIWTECIRLSNDPLFGLHFGEALQLSALGVVGEVIRTSTTVGAALELSFSLVSTITTTFHMTLQRDAGSFTATFHPSDPSWKELVPFYQTLDLLMVFLIHELDGLLLRKIKPLKVLYSRPMNDPNEYERVLRCRPTSTPDSNAVTFDNRYWDEPIISANHDLQQLLLRDFMKPADHPGAMGTLREQLRDYMMRNAYLGVIAIEDAAANFNLSVRTLQRRLKDDDTTFDALADEVRKTLAIGYLKTGAHPVKEVSLMLGYNDLSNFSRSFKRWTGVSPSEYLVSN